GLASVNADGSRRDPQLSIDGEARHDLNDLRVATNLRTAVISPKAGETEITGLPAADCCRGFNTYMASLGEGGLALRARVMNERGVFSPALESPGTRGLVDAMISVLDYTGAQINESFELPVTLAAGTQVKLLSVDPDGTPRTITSPGAESSSLSGLR